MGEGVRDKEIASSKRNQNQIKDQSAKIDTLFMTKMAAIWLISIPDL